MRLEAVIKMYWLRVWVKPGAIMKNEVDSARLGQVGMYVVIFVGLLPAGSFNLRMMVQWVPKNTLFLVFFFPFCSSFFVLLFFYPLFFFSFFPFSFPSWCGDMWDSYLSEICSPAVQGLPTHSPTFDLRQILYIWHCPFLLGCTLSRVNFVTSLPFAISTAS